MDRPVAVADAEAIGRGDRGADPGLGVANRGFHVLALGKAGRDRGRQRASGAVGILGGDARRGQRDDAVAAEEIVDALGALPVAALDQHRAASHRQQPLALARDRGLARRDRLVQQRRRFRQIRREQRGARNEFGAQALRPRRPPAADRPRSPPSPDRARHALATSASSPAAMASMVASCATIPILTALTSRSPNTASICAVTKSAGT